MLPGGFGFTLPLEKGCLCKGRRGRDRERLNARRLFVVFGGTRERNLCIGKWRKFSCFLVTVFWFGSFGFVCGGTEESRGQGRVDVYCVLGRVA